MNNLYNKLLEAGLKEKESRVYLAVLELGEANIAQIAKHSAINRSTVYLAIKSLKEKGLIRSLKRKKTYFYAEDPRKMISDLEKRKTVLESVMPNLLACFVFINKEPDVKFFEGDEGIKEIFKDLLKTQNQEVLTWYANDYKEYFDDKFFSDFFIPERKKNKIWIRAIYPNDPAMRDLIDNNTEQLRQTRIVTSDKFKIESQINLYENKKVAILSYRDKMGVIITSQSIYNTLKSFFEVMWDGAMKG